MGGQPRTTSGDAGMQDGSTPAEFLAAVERRFGKIGFDLAAHRLNRKHARYFAPREFLLKYDPKDPPLPVDTVEYWRLRGAHEEEVVTVLKMAERWGKKRTWGVPNHDPDAAALDALSQQWARISFNDFEAKNLWLNCEWADVDPWALKASAEADRGARVLLLTNLAVTDWARDRIFGRADVLLLSGRLSFDGKNVLPKDCMLSRFWSGQAGRMGVWDWRRDYVTTSWERTGGPGR